MIDFDNEWARIREFVTFAYFEKYTAITREGTEENWETHLYSVTQQGLDLDASQIHISVVKNLLSLLQLRPTF